METLWSLAAAIIWFLFCPALGALIANEKKAGEKGFVIGLIFGPLGVIAAFAMDNRPRCPQCAGRLDGEDPKVCRYCTTDLEWVEGSPMTPEYAAAYRAKQAEESQERIEESQERIKAIAFYEAERRANRERVMIRSRAIARFLTTLPGQFDAVLGKTADSESEILYRFLQVTFYAILPVAIVIGLIVACR